MLRFKQYYKVETIDEAYELNQKKANHIMAGNLWLRQQNRTVGGVIDLSGLGLDQIEETEDAFVIGAMTTLRALECHPGLSTYLHGAARESVRHIVGVQFRNMATVGGSLYGRYGFSDVLTLFLALGASVKLYAAGEVALSDYVNRKPDRDIIEYVILPKRVEHCAYLSIRNSQTDFPVLTCCMAEVDGKICGTIGARPGRAVLFCDEEGICADGITEESAASFADYVKGHVTTGTNYRAGAEYRRKMAGVLTKRALLSMADHKEGGLK